MRTKLDIAATVLKEVRALQERTGASLGEVVSQLLAEALAHRAAPAAQRRVFQWTAREMKARVDLRDKDAVRAIDGLHS